MASERFVQASSSASSRTDFRRRKEVLLKPAPEDTPKRYSQRVNFAGLIGIDPDTRELHARVPYEAYDNRGALLSKGILDPQGTTKHIFSATPGKVTVVLGLGSAGWRKVVDADHGFEERE